MTPLSAKERSLLDKARRARARAYAPYSGFRVGCAIEDARGAVFAGCNVEDATYANTVHAEMSAVVAMIGEGGRRIRRVVVVTGADEPVFPCGLCLQFLSEHGSGAEVVAVGRGGAYRRASLRELLPAAFSKTRLGRR